MNHRACGVAIWTAMLLVADVTEGQTGQVDFTLTWTEVDAGSNLPVANPNGFVEPSEAARLSISASFTPVGTPVIYQSVPPGGVAPVTGLAGFSFDMMATAANGGDWSGLTARHGFNLWPMGGSLPLPDGSLSLCGVSQDWPQLGSSPISTNPLLNVWEAVWRPSTFVQRMATFEMEPIFILGQGYTRPTLFVRVGVQPGTGYPLFDIARADATYASVEIPIVPAPCAMTVLLLGLTVSTRRHRP
jgi:hypothetical protein